MIPRCSINKSNDRKLTFFVDDTSSSTRSGSASRCRVSHGPQAGLTEPQLLRKKREKHPGLTTSDQLLPLVLLDTCVPNCSSGFCSFDATVCAASRLQLHFASAFSTSRKKVFFKRTKFFFKNVLVPAEIRLSSVLWRHRVNRHGQIS